MPGLALEDKLNHFNQLTEMALLNPTKEHRKCDDPRVAGRAGRFVGVRSLIAGGDKM
jgi:hypothetical protein